MGKSKLKFTKEVIYTMERTARRLVDIETGFKGCQHKAHKMATDYNRKKEKRVIFED